ncbi:MAG TPA: YncE family protein [Rhizomicrobium sp.]|nr:YncE family protein [Rhizomicrobium sp.]
MGRFRSAAAFWIALAAAGAAQARGAHEFVYVQATMSKELVVIDAESFKVSARIPLSDYSYDVVGSPDGRIAYLASQISSGSPLGWQVNEAGRVDAYDTASNKVVWSTFVDGSVQHMAVAPDGSRAYVALFDKNYIDVLDAKSGTILARWYATLGNHGVIVSADGKRLYVGNMLNDNIWAYDTSTGKVVNVMRAGEAVRPLALDADETHIIYQLSRFHGFKVRDLRSGETKSVDLPALPAGTELPDAFPFTVNHGLAVTPDHKKLLAAGSIAGYVAIYSLPDYKLLGTVKVGNDSNWIGVRADSKVAFVSNRGSGTLSVIDIDQLKELKQIPVGTMPQRVCVINVPERP